MSRPGIEPGPPREHSRKEPMEQLNNSYSEHLHMSPRQNLIKWKKFLYKFYLSFLCFVDEKLSFSILYCLFVFFQWPTLVCCRNMNSSRRASSYPSRCVFHAFIVILSIAYFYCHIVFFKKRSVTEIENVSVHRCHFFDLFCIICLSSVVISKC